MVTVLGIESTAHTFGIGIVRNGKILANVRKPYTTEKGGIIPSEAAKHHKEHSKEAYNEAIDISRIKPEDITAISFSQGPGLTPSLLEGIRFAKQLSKELKKPLVPVNHCISHLEIGGILKNKPKDPVMLYASGANTQIIAYASGRYRVFGETLDLGIGNFIDTFARYTGKGFPGGPIVEKLALQGKNFIELPYKVKGMDIALSGILTNLKQKFDKGEKLEDLSYSLQENVFAMLVEVAERALAHTGKKELLLAGGVGCNSRLQEMCKIMCEERGAKFFCPEKPLLVDNGAMIAFLGEIMFKSGIKFSGKRAEALDVKPRQRTDDLEVLWR